MKHLLLTLMALFMASTAMASSYMYMEDQTVYPGEQITLPIMAHFNGRVGGFQLDLTYPEGVTPVDVECGEDMTVTYLKGNGSSAEKTAMLVPNQDYSRVVGVFMDPGFWDPDGDGTYETYGSIKWEAGDYDELLLITLNIDSNFESGELLLTSELSAGSDPRGGTVNEIGENYPVVMSCNLTIPPIEVTPMPVLYCEEGEEFYTITAIGEGEVRLYIDGEEVGNPYQIALGENERVIVVEATAQMDGYLMSETAVMEVLIPAKPVDPVDPDPADYALTMADAEVLHGNNVVIPVSMTNAQAITAFQTDVYLPEGFELLDVVLSSRKSSDHVVMKNAMADGATRILCYSLSLSPFEGNEGELFYITVSVPADAAGDYTLMLKKNLLTTATDNSEVRCQDSSSNLNVWAYIVGDANGDGEVTVSDIVAAANYILGKNPQPFVLEAADVNGDGDITVTDVVLIARIILNPSMDDLNRAPAVGMNNDAMNGEDISIAAGETRTVSIALDNEVGYTAFQLDMQLPDGLTAKNFRLTNRAGGHALDANVLEDGTQRVMCYSPMLSTIDGHEGAVLTFEVTAMGEVNGDILVDGIEMVTANCQTVIFDSFAMKVNNGATSVKELTGDLRIYTDGHDIIVESPVAQRVVISDMAGRAYSVDVAAGRTVIPARNSGVVVVNAGEKTAKLMIK